MSLTGQQHLQLHAALLAAFDEAGLRRLVKFYLDKNLDQVAGGRDLTEVAFNLVAWADVHGCVNALIAGAVHQNSTNPELIAVEEAARLWHVEKPESTDVPPYKGLKFYDAADADLFFGREKLTAELVCYLKDHNFLAIVGASGSGKSSIVRAGIVPAIRKGEIIKDSEEWALYMVTPKARPLIELAAELTKDSESNTAQTTLIDEMRTNPQSLDLFATRLAARTKVPRVLLVVDQFEELFTHCKDTAEQKAFVDNLLGAAISDGVMSVIITLRADFYAECAKFANLRAALQDWQKYIGPMSHEELRAAIEKPAEKGRWDFEAGLVDDILSDVEGQAGALPLLAQALLETWKRRSGRTMTFAGYHAAGGVRGAIAKTADAVYAELSSDQQAIVRNIFLRLTTLGEGTQDTRRHAPLAELLGSSEQAVQVRAVLKRLEDERLVTAERVTEAGAGPDDKQVAVYVDVTHEAIIREWPRLDTWLREDREGLVVHRRLTEAAEEWEAMQRETGVLFRGARLAQTTDWAAAHSADLTDLEEAFLDASQAQVDAEQREKERVRQEREEAQKRALEAAEALAAEQQQRAEEQAAAAGRLKLRNRGLTAALAAVVMLLVAAGFLFYWAQDRAVFAEQQKTIADANLELAQQKLDDLKVESLLSSARSKKANLDAAGAVADFNAARAAAAEKGETLEVAGEISDTLRYVAAHLVQEGERTLCRAKNGRPAVCEALVTDSAVAREATSVPIAQTYLAWAQDVAPQIVGWASYTSTVQQQAIISATALYSQALALNPPSDTPIYVWIAPGVFTMGSSDEQLDAIITQGKDRELAQYRNEQPEHKVNVGGFWIQRTEVTTSQFAACVKADICEEPNNTRWQMDQFGRHPIIGVGWNPAQEYAAWVGGRLPTEAEWEKACRGNDGRIYPWGNTKPTAELLNYPPSKLGIWLEIGSYPSGVSPYGLYDMAGNSWEWVQDWYDAGYYKSSPLNNPQGPAVAQTERTIRGGSFVNDNVHCAYRNSNEPDEKGLVGFRVAAP